MYKKNFVVRWSEIDPNMHLTSSAYVRYVTDARMSFFEDNEFGLNDMIKHKIGPIVLSEKCYYFKEINPGEAITVTWEKCGSTPDHRFTKIEQRIFNENGENSFLSLTLIAFMDVVDRKIAIPPAPLLEILKSAPQSERFKILEKSDLRDAEAFPTEMSQ